jgi:16S rRNA (guanine966-N2)-methyltransferase
MPDYTTRITAGTLRYKIIRQPGSGTRPVSQKVRQAIMSVLGDDLTGLAVLDLYAGSGALGFEALSRGAVRVLAVEKAHAAAKCLQANAAELGVQPEYKIVQEDVRTFLGRDEDSYDIIFFDPPYVDFDVSLAEQAASKLDAAGVFVVSCSSREKLADILGPAKLVKTREYGDTQIVYYKNKLPLNSNL